MKYVKDGKNEHPDGNGLFFEIYPTGVKSWSFRYNVPYTGKRTKFTIGNYPDVSIAQARAKRDEFRALLAQGIDPQVHKKKLEEEQKLANNNTFLAVAEKWKEKKQGEITEKTLTKYWRSLELHVFPFYWNVPNQ